MNLSEAFVTDFTLLSVSLLCETIQLSQRSRTTTTHDDVTTSHMFSHYSTKYVLRAKDKFTTDFNSFDLNGNYQYTVKTPRQKTKENRIFDDVDKTRHISPDYPVMSSLSG